MLPLHITFGSAIILLLVAYLVYRTRWFKNWCRKHYKKHHYGEYKRKRHFSDFFTWWLQPDSEGEDVESHLSSGLRMMILIIILMSGVFTVFLLLDMLV